MVSIKKVKNDSISMNEIKKRILKPQLHAFKKILRIYSRNYVVRNTSEPGTGKTELAFIVAKFLGLPIGCITNKNIIPKCRSLAEKHDVELAFVINYESLRGRNQHCNHDFLINNGENYEITAKTRNLLNNGILILGDEIQKAKNPNSWQHKAFCAIAREVPGTKSRIMLASTTPLAERENMISVPRLCGIVTHELLVEYDKKQYKYKKLGFQELEDYCMDINPELTTKNLPRSLNDKNAFDAFYNLTTKVLIPEITVNIKKKHDFQNVVQNRFYSVDDPVDFATITEASDKIKQMFRICTSRRKFGAMSGVRSEYDGIAERIKLKIIAREIKKIKNHPLGKKVKFLVFVWRLESAKTLKQLLEEFADKIAVVNGSTEDDERERIRLKFQEDNDEIEIVIGNPTVMGSGGDWDDLYTDRPRVNFIVTNCRFPEIYQSSERTHRLTSKSHTFTTLVHIKDVATETRNWEKMADKLQTVDDCRNEKTTFPIDQIDDDEFPFNLDNYKDLLITRVPDGSSGSTTTVPECSSGGTTTSNLQRPLVSKLKKLKRTRTLEV